jgi:hypothetical protein
MYFMLNKYIEYKEKRELQIFFFKIEEIDFTLISEEKLILIILTNIKLLRKYINILEKCLIFRKIDKNLFNYKNFKEFLDKIIIDLDEKKLISFEDFNKLESFLYDLNFKYFINFGKYLYTIIQQIKNTNFFFKLRFPKILSNLIKLQFVNKRDYLLISYVVYENVPIYNPLASEKKFLLLKEYADQNLEFNIVRLNYDQIASLIGRYIYIYMDIYVEEQKQIEHKLTYFVKSFNEEINLRSQHGDANGNVIELRNLLNDICKIEFNSLESVFRILCLLEKSCISKSIDFTKVINLSETNIIRYVSHKSYYSIKNNCKV